MMSLLKIDARKALCSGGRAALASFILVGVLGSVLGGVLSREARAGRARGRRGAAERELDSIIRAGKVGAQASAMSADSYFDAAKKAYAELEYAKALELVEKALEANPNHPEARRLAEEVRALLGVLPDHARHSLEQLTREKKIQIQESLHALQQAFEKGKRSMALADEQPPEDAQRPAEMIFSRQIRDLERAVSQFKKVLEIIKWMPYQVNLSQTEQEVRGLLSEALDRRAEREEGLRVARRESAIKEAKAHRGIENEVLREKVKQLLAMARIEYNRGNYEKCEDFCSRIMDRESSNKDAKALLFQAREKRHERRGEEVWERTRHEWRNTFLKVEEAAIPYSQRIRYPENWEQILRRVERVGQIEQEEQPEWARNIERRLDRKVSFEFAETPLSEAVQFLQTLTKVNMILDPNALQERGNTPITLKVTNMTLRLALDWILKLADLDYALKDSAIFISTKEKLKGEVTLRIYDVRDLTEQVPDFPGPELMLEVGGVGGGMGGAPGLTLMAPEEDMEEVTPASLAEMIMQRVRPDEWAGELGTSIEERGGKLVCMQRPEVHRLIDRLLESFRASQKLLVTVEARFLEIREGFFQEVGVDFGNMPNYEAAVDVDANDASLYLQGTGQPWGPAAPGGSWTMSPNAFGNANPQAHGPVHPGGYIDSQALTDTVYGGMMLQPRNVDIFGDGVMHVIGSQTNYRPNVSPEQTRIGMDLATGELLNQGLNAQIRHIGNLEVMAFLHALRIREGGSVLSAPRITVTNTQRAHMFIAEQRSYVADYEISGDAYDPVVRHFLQGTVFDVKPIVSADRRYITMELRPTTAQLLRMTTIYLDVVTTLSGGTIPLRLDLTLPIQFPELELRKIRTTVTIPDGGIIMLGGMMSDVKFQSETGVPFLSNIPVVGKLFRWNITDNERSNLSVLVTGRILLFEEEEHKR